MTLWAIVSDVHSRGDRLARVLNDAHNAGAERILSLGDVGSTAAIDLLDQAGATSVFGNWEASGLRGLSRPHRSYVGAWPAYIKEQVFWAAHASPVWPDGLQIRGVVEHLRRNSLHWQDLFPSLQRSADARWAAFAALEAAHISAFFHGHTHVQEAWRWQAGTAPIQVHSSTIQLDTDDSLWLIGVGSVGDPHDDGGPAYALFDDQMGRVALRRV
jgi:predicted phosphodiesterase